MKPIERISKYQIAVMIVLFQIGSTPLFQLGGKAKQDSWLAMAFAGLIGLALVLMYLSIQKKQPHLGLFDILHLYFGRWIGCFIGILYMIYFSYESMRNVRDFGELFTIGLLSQTPMYIIMLILVLISGYAVFSGVEVIFRMSELLLLFVVVSYAILIALFFITGIVHYNLLTPMLENGLTPVLKAGFPDIVSFPFGQMVIFLMFWHMNTEKRIPMQMSVLSYISVALFLIFMNATNLAILGPTIAAISTLPLLQATQLISVAHILERMDVFATLLVYIGLFIKMTAFYLCAVLGVAQLTNKSSRVWVGPIGLMIFIASFLEPNYSYHIWVGLEISVKFFTVFQIVIPFALWITVMLRRKQPVLPG